jgi:SRSO17 transposase
MAEVARQGDHCLGHPVEAGLLIDETSFLKKGDRSVGVARQYLGRLGKVDNGQVAVFGALSRKDRVLPIDVRLFLPEEWIQDPARCQRAGIPESGRQYKTKKELALEIVDQTRQQGSRFGWVGGDAAYGSGLDFLYALDERPESFLIDIHKDQHIYLTDPAPVIPVCSGKTR